MKKTNSLLLKVLDAEKSIIFFPVVELIPDELESLEEELNILGAKIILLNYSIKKKHEVLRGDLFKG